MASLLPVPEPDDPVEGALGHFDHSNWVKQALKNLDQGTVHSSSGSVSGGLTVDELVIDNSADEYARLRLRGNSFKVLLGERADGKARWQINLGDGTAEGGNDSGSNFQILAWQDSGIAARTAVTIERSTGKMHIAGPPTAPTHAATKEYVDTGMPIGAIIAFGGSSIPVAMQPYWHMCNGTAHGSAALQAVIGSANAPDLSGKFIVGVGTGYDPKATGGVAQNTLTPAQTATKGHTHPAISQPEAQEHQHIVDPPLTWSSGVDQFHSHHGWTSWMDRNNVHGHNFNMTEGVWHENQDGVFLDTTDQSQGYVRSNSQSNISAWLDNVDVNHLHEFQTEGDSVNHSHYVDIAPFWSSGRSATHTHVIAVTGTVDANATAPIENRPPFYALVYIIKKA